MPRARAAPLIEPCCTTAANTAMRLRSSISGLLVNPHWAVVRLHALELARPRPVHLARAAKLLVRRFAGMRWGVSPSRMAQPCERGGRRKATQGVIHPL